jgi:hypothetical protein
MAVKKSKKGTVPAKTPEELLQQVRDLAQKVPADKLGAALKKVAAARGLSAAQLHLTFDATKDDPYYNVYRYAFFGLVPEQPPELEHQAVTASGPKARTLLAKRPSRKR